MRFETDKCVGVIVDVQERLFTFMQQKERLETNLIILIKGLRVLGVPLLKTQQYTSGLGPTIDSVDDAYLEQSCGFGGAFGAIKIGAGDRRR